jgi:asparagine synthase (glutamine-hydrolysing)
MCGIAGFTTFASAPSDRDAVIRSMTAAVRHRGPDGEGYFQDSSVLLGQCRLAVIDLPGGRQPMPDRGDRYQILYNGEVYNYLELRKELEDRGHVFKTRSDTEVVLEWLACDGVAALRQFNGMFALALWDRAERKLLLARDRIGIKPLFYCFHGPDIIFASELKALLRHPSVSRQIDPESVDKYFTYGYVPAPHTIYAGIFKLEPGAWMEIDAAGSTQNFYWDMSLADNPVSASNFQECQDRVLSLMRQAVRRQLRSDVPVGVFLSGGIDSSAITALAAQEASGRIHSFSIGFDEPTYDESRYAASVASRYNTIHHEETFTLEKAAALFPEVILSMDEPLADASLLPTWFLSQLAARHVKVALGGDGSDELFAGYPSFQAHKIVERLSFLPSGCRDWLGSLARRIPVSHHYASAGYLLQQFLKGAGVSPEVRFLLWMGYYGNQEKRRLFSPELREKLAGADVFEDAYRYVRRSGLTDSFQRLQYLCMKLYFQDDILVKLDRASMAHSLEARVPFMDSDLVEFATHIQPFYKLNGLTTKHVLKQALKGLLPEAIPRRRKAGFMMPVASWLTGHMRETIEEVCAPAALSNAGFFDPAYVRTLLDEHFQNQRDHRKHIYPLLCFMAWLRNQQAN